MMFMKYKMYSKTLKDKFILKQSKSFRLFRKQEFLNKNSKWKSIVHLGTEH